MTTMTASIFGSTGLIGSALSQSIGSPYETVYLPVRRDIPSPGPLLRVQKVGFDDLSRYPELFSVRDIFYCLGTTRKTAGSARRFEEIELGISTQVIDLAKKHGCQRFFLLSSAGANPGSSFLYTRVKGEIETHLERARIPTAAVFKPSILMGHRTEKRVGESIAILGLKPFVPLLQKLIPKGAPIRVNEVVKAMLGVASTQFQGFEIFENDRMIQIAKTV